MDKEHRNLIRRNRSYIKDNIANVGEVVDKLYEKGVLTQDMMEEIMLSSKSQQTFEMLNIIPKRGSKAFGLFIESLNETGNEEVAGHLSQGVIPRREDYTVQPIPKPSTVSSSSSVNKPSGEPKNSGQGDVKEASGLSGDPKNGKLDPGGEKEKINQGDLKNSSKVQESWVKKELPLREKMEVSTEKFFLEMRSQHQNDMYNMSTKNKGMCQCLMACPCSDLEKTRIETMMKYAGFEYKNTLIREQHNKQDIKKMVDAQLSKAGESTCSFVLIAISPGDRHDRIYGKCEGSEFVPVSEIVEMFKACKDLNGKPKVILVVNIPSIANKECSESNATEYPHKESVAVGEVTEDMKNMDLIDGATNDDDMFIISCMPTDVKNFFTEKNSESYFGHALQHILFKHAHEEEFVDLMKKLCMTLQDKDGSFCCRENAEDNTPNAKGVSLWQKERPLASVRVITRPAKKKFFIFPGFDGPSGSQCTQNS